MVDSEQWANVKYSRSANHQIQLAKRCRDVAMVFNMLADVLCEEERVDDIVEAHINAGYVS